MSRQSQSVLLGLVGLLLLRLSLTDDFLTYVKPVMRPFIVLAGIALIGLAAALIRAERGSVMDHAAMADGAAEPSDGHGHDGHDAHGPPRLAWILTIPIAVVFIVAPQPLGAYFAERQSSWSPDAPTAASGWPPALRSPVEGAHELTLGEFNMRAYFDEGRSLEGARVRLTGFVRGGSDGVFLLTRFRVNCCAADGTAISVRVTGHDDTPPNDSWLVVEGTWLPNEPDLDWEATDDGSWATLVADNVRPIPQPREPYESS